MHTGCEQATVLEIREVASDIVHATLSAPAVAGNARPGQFVMAQAQDEPFPLLRRPLSLCNAGKDTIELLFQVRGSGTGVMAGWQKGQSISVLGPLGNGFAVPDDLDTALLVAGGIGIAPLLYLSRFLTGQHTCERVQLFWGGRTEEHVGYLDAFDIPAAEAVIATDDGSKGFQGVVTDVVAAAIEKKVHIESRKAAFFACGPQPMARSVALLAEKHSLDCQVSLEARMACGVGACLGCVVGAAGAESADVYKRVCVDGPVFKAGDVDWSNVTEP